MISGPTNEVWGMFTRVCTARLEQGARLGVDSMQVEFTVRSTLVDRVVKRRVRSIVEFS